MNKKFSEIKDIESKLWSAADSLRGNMSAEEYQYVIIGILVLKYINDRYQIASQKIKNDNITIELIGQEKFYNVYNAFIVPKIATWNYLKNFASDSIIGQKIDEAFTALEKKNPILKGIFNKNYNRREFNQEKLGEIVQIFSDVNFSENDDDLIGRVYEYFLGKFFRKRDGGEFYTPKTIVKLMVSLLKPTKGTIYDPCCGTAGILIQAKKFVKEHNGDHRLITAFGQEYNSNTWKLAKLNLLLHGFSLKDTDDNDVLGKIFEDTLKRDLHKERKFDYVMANPPFNVSKWGYQKLLDDPRWKWGIPPKGNANYAWIQHILTKLTSSGKACLILAEGSLSSENKNEKEIRKNLINDNKVDAIIQLPNKLFYTTSISCSIWILNNDKKNTNVLMIYGYQIKTKIISKKLCELSAQNIDDIDLLYQQHLQNKIINQQEFAKSVSNQKIIENDYSFVPGHYLEWKEEKIDQEKLKKDIQKDFQTLKEILESIDQLKEDISKIDEKDFN